VTGCTSPLDAWAEGGLTNVDRLLSLCRYHHVKVHEGHWQVDFDSTTGEVWVTRPDGRPYELGPSQPFTTPARRGPTIPGQRNRPAGDDPTDGRAGDPPRDRRSTATPEAEAA
jgi:hypothetical protein